jgi:hypothetical protein
LTYTISRNVTLGRGPPTGAGSEFLTERQLEDAATPHLTRPRVLYLVFKEPAAVTQRGLFSLSANPRYVIKFEIASISPIVSKPFDDLISIFIVGQRQANIIDGILERVTATRAINRSEDFQFSFLKNHDMA